MKIITFYLPQYHEIPENDEWWGKGFTEWVNVKKSKPLYEDHYQPRIPYENNYYDLSDIDVMRWQAKLAKDHGVYGFCFYHYWFGGKLLLEKPVENYLNDKSIEFPFCISWANEHWTNQWVSSNSNVLIEQNYGDEEEWIKHFNYLLPYLQDSRYIRKDGKPVLIIYRPELIDNKKQMLTCWQRLARENGFKGLCLMGQRVDVILNNPNADISMFDNFIEYQPGTVFVTFKRKNELINKLKQIKRRTDYFIEKNFPMFNEVVSGAKNEGIKVLDYDEIWNFILNSKPIYKSSIPCAFVDWDNSPRKGERATIVNGANPIKFEKYLRKLIKKTTEEYKQDMLFMFAWNEWAEGGYLEPDCKYEYQYLQAIQKALMAENE